MSIKKTSRRSQSRTGAMLPLIGVTLVILFVAAVLAVDIARIHVTRSELRTATDAAARAAVEALGRTDSESAALEAALMVARLNPVAGKGLELDPDNVVFGSAQQKSDGSFEFVARRDFTGRAFIPNSVRIVGERVDGSPDGPVNMMFGGMFGQSTFQPVQVAAAARLDRDISLVLDKSGSMRSNGRFRALLNGVDVFISELQATTPKESVSLVAYDTRPSKLLELTDDLDAIADRIRRERPGGRTGIGLAMRVGLRSVLRDPQARSLALKSIVVMTDGNQNQGVSPMVVARQCRRANVTVHTITFSAGANQNLMRRVAEETGGTHLHATNDEQLIEAFETIARQLQVLLIE